MTDDQPAPQPARSLRTDRLEAFTDGVLAIAITLLVLELAVPAGSEDDLFRAFLEQWPSYLAYVVSFSTIGAIWLAHSAITEYLERADSVLIRLNLLLLLVVAFLPFPTKLLAENIHKDSAERVAVTIYGINLFLASLLVAVLWRYAVREKLVRADAADEEIEVLTRRLTPGLTSYVVLIGVGLLLPIAAVIGYLGVALYFIVPLKLLKRRHPTSHQ